MALHFWKCPDAVTPPACPDHGVPMSMVPNGWLCFVKKPPYMEAPFLSRHVPCGNSVGVGVGVR